MAHDHWTGAELFGQLTGGRYRVTGPLADGGMAAIYRGRRTDGAEVVVKMPLPSLLANPHFRGRFQREVKSLAAVTHPHVVRLLDSGERGGVPFLVVPYCGGGTLESRQRRSGGEPQPMPFQTLAGWLNPVAAAVDHLHAQNLVHRDLKPANIFFDTTGMPLVADFGIVKVASDDPNREATVYTQPGSTLGTPAYMAPELIMGRKVDGRADVYALGVMAYEWLTGRLPFDGTNPANILVKQFSAAKTLTHPSDIVPAVPRELAAVVLRAMAINPAERFSRATEFAAAVAAAVRSAAPVVESPPSDIPAEKDLKAADAAPLPVVPPVPARPSFRQRFALPTGWPSWVVIPAHLLFAWVVLVSGLAYSLPIENAVEVGRATVVVSEGWATASTVAGFDLLEGMVALTLWPLTFLAVGVLVWIRQPPARVVGLILAAVVGAVAATQLLAGVLVVRPVLLGGWLAPWWVGAPYAVVVWVASFHPRFSPAFEPESPPHAVTVLAVVSVVLGGALALGTVTGMVRLGGELSAGHWVLLSTIGLTGAGLCVAAVGLTNRQEWARLTVVGLAGILALSIIGLGYFVAAVLILFRRGAMKEFRDPHPRRS